jgi:hypothetical protein
MSSLLLHNDFLFVALVVLVVSVLTYVFAVRAPLAKTQELGTESQSAEKEHKSDKSSSKVETPSVPVEQTEDDAADGQFPNLCFIFIFLETLRFSDQML